jgi:soluble lytic murein transglycosylase-like protein
MVAPPGNQAANGENKPQPAASEEAGLLDSFISLSFHLPQTAQVLYVRDPFDPEANIIGGTRYLRLLPKQYKWNVRLALAAYNTGSERVDSYQDVTPFEETRGFVKRVLKYAGGYESQN